MTQITTDTQAVIDANKARDTRSSISSLETSIGGMEKDAFKGKLSMTNTAFSAGTVGTAKVLVSTLDKQTQEELQPTIMIAQGVAGTVGLIIKGIEKEDAARTLAGLRAKKDALENSSATPSATNPNASSPAAAGSTPPLTNAFPSVSGIRAGGATTPSTAGPGSPVTSIVTGASANAATNAPVGSPTTSFNVGGLAASTATATAGVTTSLTSGVITPSGPLPPTGAVT